MRPVGEQLSAMDVDAERCAEMQRNKKRNMGAKETAGKPVEETSVEM